jgi:ABC-type phosphate/phosphonate transport system permease subunit
MSRQEAECVGTLRESFFPVDSHLDSSLMSNDPHTERLVVQTIFIKLFGIAAAIPSSTALSRSLSTVQEIDGYH